MSEQASEIYQFVRGEGWVRRREYYTHFQAWSGQCGPAGIYPYVPGVDATYKASPRHLAIGSVLSIYIRSPETLHEEYWRVPGTLRAPMSVVGLYRLSTGGCVFVDVLGTEYPAERSRP